ncbi:hypothetical protein BCR44DRAFT_1428391 [Catenaria anguillulae PL171]|uniref:BTB domain-containing protein n=1 Tax=Catenaria anguillulae PL171 TaxID=765915 RepID=A0A1Y2HXN3_9FUNG|nr:hypothetical protein BCR44DRAFT_1428391 [Catenaria anguillulae PL171]
MLATLNDANLCDASLVPAGTNGNGIHPYFKTMFNGDWVESAANKCDKPIDFDWTATAVLPCLMHMYSGWVLGDTVPDCAELKELLDKHKVDTQRLTLHQLLELVDLAEMLELPLLVHSTYEIMAMKVGRKVKTSAVMANKLNQRARVVEGVGVDKASDVEE